MIELEAVINNNHIIMTPNNYEWILSQKSRRFASLLGFEFRRFSPAVALQILETSRKSSSEDQTSLRLLKTYFTSYDLERMELYGKGVVDYHLIVDILPQMVKMIFTGELNIKGLSVQQKAILVALGLQYKSVRAINDLLLYRLSLTKTL